MWALFLERFPPVDLRRAAAAPDRRASEARADEKLHRWFRDPRTGQLSRRPGQRADTPGHDRGSSGADPRARSQDQDEGRNSGPGEQ